MLFYENNDGNISFVSFYDHKLSIQKDEVEETVESNKATTQSLAHGTLNKCEDIAKSPEVENAKDFKARQEAI